MHFHDNEISNTCGHTFAATAVEQRYAVDRSLLPSMLCFTQAFYIINFTRCHVEFSEVPTTVKLKYCTFCQTVREFNWAMYKIRTEKFLLAKFHNHENVAFEKLQQFLR